MNTVTINSSPDLPYESLETGSVFGFILPQGSTGSPCMKLETGHIYLDTGEEYQDPARDKVVSYTRCRLLRSVTITRG